MGLQTLKYNEWPFDYMLITTASEQNEYFKVMIKAFEMLTPKLKGKIKHLGFGMIQLKTGKMSSRTGNIITGVNLIDQAIAVVKRKIENRELTDEEKKNIAEVVGIGAVKYSRLKTDPLQDSIFDFEESISFEGNSGPYLQYTYTRARSILKDANVKSIGMKSIGELNFEEESLLRSLYRYPQEVINAAKNLAPNIICSYLFDLAQKFNLFYKKHKVIKARSDNLKKNRLALTASVAQVMKNGLNMLGIDVLEKM
jgi:arginyl-tRNA synthetase